MQYLVLGSLALACLALAVYTALKKRKLRRERDFQRRLETLLQPKETVKALCPGKQGRWILTNKRLLIESGEGFTAIPFSRVKKVTGTAADGKSTTAAGKMNVLIVKTDREFSLARQGENFEALVKGLKAGVSEAKKK